MLSSCNKQAHTAPYINFSTIDGGEEIQEPTPDVYLPPTRIPDLPVYTPTPSPPRPLPTLRTEDVYYIVEWGDNLKTIAYQFNLLPEFGKLT